MDAKVFQCHVYSEWRDGRGFGIDTREGVATGMEHSDGDELIREHGSFYSPRRGKWHDTKEAAIKSAIEVLHSRMARLRQQIDQLRTEVLNGVHEETPA